MGFWTKPAKDKEAAVLPGREGDQMRVHQLELQLQELATTAAQAVDRAEKAEKELNALNDRRQEQEQLQHKPSISSSSSLNNSLFSAPSRSSSFTTLDTKLDDELAEKDAEIEELKQKVRALLNTNEELRSKIKTEEQLRKDCESRELALTEQIEDLSSSLFEEANQKVAFERQKNAVYEEKFKRMNSNDSERDQRWHNIEVAIAAVRKARTALNSSRMHRHV